MSMWRVAVALAGLGVCVAAGARAQEAGAIEPKTCLTIGPVGTGGRWALHRDVIEAKIVAGTWTAPKAGDAVETPGGPRTWRQVSADNDGAFGVGGYAYFEVPSDAEHVYILEAAGHSLVYVNGEPRVGDPYSNGSAHVPVLLHKGANSLLFLGGRGQLRVRLVPPTSPIYLDLADPTLPDAQVGAPLNALGGLVLVNATPNTLKGVRITTSGDDMRTTAVEAPAIPPMTVRKVAVRFCASSPSQPGQLKVTVTVTPPHALGLPESQTEVALSVKKPTEPYKRTFVSDIDGSVQYYGVNPPPTRPASPALFLTLHGASVEGIGQASAYAAKTWGYLIAPTNRRPYGFDWEDWGMTDAIEVLDDAQRVFKTDPSRTYLTGHSMGGHGTWIVGTTHANRFAAIAPSAGWVSFNTYGGGQRANQSPIEQMLGRASAPGDTPTLIHNLTPLGVYILHGDADDNVPVTEARAMRDMLKPFHTDLGYHEQPGAGHWWGVGDEPGSACVDWAPIFDMFARRSIPENEAVRFVDFTTANPQVSSTMKWVTIEAQDKALLPSRVKLRYDPWRRRFQGTTENVARLTFDVAHLIPGAPMAVELDGQRIADIKVPAKATRASLARAGGTWRVMEHPAPASEKGPQRYGPFKRAFGHRAILVYGTHGTPEENAAAFAKARYDAETFWYRGNGAFDVVADTAFDAKREKDRNVVLYGNADSNSAWAALLGGGAVQVKRGSVRVGTHEFSGDSLAAFFVQPRPGSDVALVGAIAGSGAAGMRLAQRVPIFLSGAGFPDCLVLGPETLTQGTSGVRAAGFFGLDWKVETGEFAWQE